MPKFAVMVECMVPQFTLVIVECDAAEQIEDYANQEKIWEAAGERAEGWEYDTSADCANEPSRVEVVDAAEWNVNLEEEPEIKL